MATHNETVNKLTAEIEELTEVKTQGAGIEPVTITLTDENMDDFDAEALGKIQIPAAEAEGEKTTAAGSGPETITFDASSYVEQGVIIADKLLQRLFDWLDKVTVLYSEDRQALDYLIWKEKNGLNKAELTNYEKWLLAQGQKLKSNSDERVMTDSEKQNFVKALQAMPWIKDKLMTPTNQLTWALLLYFGVRVVPVAFNLLGGKEVPPEDITAHPEPENKRQSTPPPLTSNTPPQPVAQVITPEVKPVEKIEPVPQLHEHTIKYKIPEA